MAGQLKKEHTRVSIRRSQAHWRPAPALQYGGIPKDAKPFKGIGSGVIEIVLRHDGEAYRTVVALRIGGAIYVLHAFQKKSKKGVATPKQHVDLIKQRYKEAKELAESEQG